METEDQGSFFEDSESEDDFLERNARKQQKEQRPEHKKKTKLESSFFDVRKTLSNS